MPRKSSKKILKPVRPQLGDGVVGDRVVALAQAHGVRDVLLAVGVERAEHAGVVDDEGGDAAMALLRPTLAFDALGECDLVIEAAYEDMAVKQEIFGRLDKVAKPGALLASNTSYLSIDEIAAATTRPDQSSADGLGASGAATRSGGVRMRS